MALAMPFCVLSLAPVSYAPDTPGSIPVGQIDIADGIINLILIVLVFLVLGHASQFLHHFIVVSASHGFGLQDTGVERQFVWRIGTYDTPQGLVGFCSVSRFVVQLSQQEVQACALLFAFFFLDGFFANKE